MKLPDYVRRLRFRSEWLLSLVFGVIMAAPAMALPQTVPSAASNPPGRPDADGSPAESLQSLIAEALAHSPLITAARRGWEAQERRPVQESTLPDPKITFQNMAVGNAIPGNDLQTNNFAYFGYGVTQDIPFPGKLRLRGSVAQKQAQAAREAYQAQERSVVEQVRETYLNLFYLQRTLDLLRQTYREFRRVAQITEAQYEVGTARQQDVLKAQLEMTSILSEEQTAHEGFEQGQADLKAILGREQDSPKIPITNAQPAAFTLTDRELRHLAMTGSPIVKRAEALEAKSQESLELAREGYIPDFSISYMYQKTGSRFPDYYVATLGVKIPLYFWRRQTPAIDEAALEKQSADAATYATKLSVVSQAQNEWIAVQTNRRVMKIYRDGLIPQAEATLKSALTSYTVGKVDFQTLLSAEIDVLRLKQQLYRTEADDEIAIAKIRQVVGEVK